MVWWFVETAVVSAGLAVVAWLASRFRGLGPAVRHAFWLVVMLKLITPPLVSSPWALPRPLMAVDPIARSSGDSATSIVEESEDPRLVELARIPLFPSEKDREFSIERSEESAPKRDEPAAGATPPSWMSRFALTSAAWTWLLLLIWALASFGFGVVQALRLFRFARGLRGATPAPGWVMSEIEALAARLRTRAPRALAVPGLGVPMLWCLGRPTLLLPTHLLANLSAERWRGVLAHELAHLRRGDPWVARLILGAGLAWWWNPVYWWAKRRLEAEAELACDAWVVATLPEERVVYAGTMLDICESLSPRSARSGIPPLAPALGDKAAGGFFERRLMMILRDHVPYRLSAAALLGPGLLALVGLPVWTTVSQPRAEAKAVASLDDDEAARQRAQARAEADKAREALEKVRVEMERAKDQAAKARAEASERAEQARRAELEKAEARVIEMRRLVRNPDDPGLRRAQESVEKARAAIEKARATESNPEVLDRYNRALAEANQALRRLKEAQADDGRRRDADKVEPRVRVHVRKKGDAKPDDDSDAEARDQEKKAARDFEKELEEGIRELSKAFGSDSDFVKHLEHLGPELETRLREKLGPGSEFESKMKDLGARIGKELEQKLGPGSDFDKTMKELAKAITENFGPGSEFAEKMKQLSREIGERVAEETEKGKGEPDRPEPPRPPTARPARPEPSERPDRLERPTRLREAQLERKTQELEARIKELTRELEKLRGEKQSNKDDVK